MEAEEKKALPEYFAGLEDPRAQSRHGLQEMLLVAVRAV